MEDQREAVCDLHKYARVPTRLTLPMPANKEVTKANKFSQERRTSSIEVAWPSNQ